MKEDITRLDPDELIHLAIDASIRNFHAEAIELLKRLLDISPTNTKAHFLLGAEYAQIGMIDRAVVQMTQAVAIDPAMHIARFQLGLLYLTLGNITEASKTWAPLSSLGDAHYLFLFKSGLEHLAGDQFKTCRIYLSRGIAANMDNPALSSDMQRILDKLPEPDGGCGAEGEPNAFFLSAYTGNTH